MAMSIEEKMVYIRKALEMGASVDLNLHAFKKKEEAEQAALELSELSGFPNMHKSHRGSNWYKIKSDDYTMETAIFYDDDEIFMEEDIWGTEEDEHVG